MRNDIELVAILDNIKAATPPEPEMLPPEKWGILYMPVPSWRRAMNLARDGRLEKIEAMAATLAERTRTPPWMARMAMDAVIPVDHEQELDDSNNDGAALERGASVMGLDPSSIAWSSPPSH